MKRNLAILIAAALLVLPAAGLAGAGRPTVKLARTSLGRILVRGANGFTVYVFTHDRRNQDRCSSDCRGVWPPLLAKGSLVAGAGVKQSLLGRIKLARNTWQVTYAGHPLYTYVGDTGPGQTDYVGANEFGGSWYVIAASGKVVK